MNINNCSGRTRVDLAAYYFPGFHADPTTAIWHGDGWTEWEVLANARPRFPDHRQPRVPAWGAFDESDPAWARRQAKLAADHGIDVFLFDWYWYEGRPFLNGALDRGFLGSPSLPLRFGIMWANHDWLDIHPAGSAAPPRVLLNGAVSDYQFDAMADFLVEHYFLHENYYRPQGEPYFSIYEPQTLVDGFGSMARAGVAIDRLRDRVERAGLPGLHLNLVVTDRAVLPGERLTSNLHELIGRFQPSSATSYVWIHHYDPAQDGFPVGSYERTAEANAAIWSHLRDALPVPYHPNVTVGWDSSPRTVQSDRYVAGDYPWMSILDGTPGEYGRALTRALEFAADSGSGSVPMVTINAWNEWTEGSYLLPDTTYGTAFLDETRRAVGAVSPRPEGIPDEPLARKEAV